MQVHGNEITVHRGESWTLSKKIRNKDGSPYIISNALTNPYWLITISSQLYTENDRYVLNKWLDLSDFLRFHYTRPMRLKDINLDYNFNNISIPTGYEGDETSGYANIAIFYDIDNDGVISYKYWEYINNIEGDYDGQWVDYECPIVTTFTTEITKNWYEQNYYYNIVLIDGISTLDYLREVAYGVGINIEDSFDDTDEVEKLFNAIKEIDEALLCEIKDFNKPIIEESEMFVILPATKLLVQSNLKGVS